MAEIRSSEWLPKGWKVEVRVRKTGRKDRYYTDPDSGLIFRSLRDIDRYLLTGKLGRHVVKPKPNGQTPVDAPAEASMVKDSNTPNGPEKSTVRDQKQNPAMNVPKKAVSGGIKSDQKFKNRKISKPSHNKGLNACFILDPDPDPDVTGVNASDGHDIPNLEEIIDSVRKGEDGGDSVYLSVQDIAALLGRQKPNDDAAKENGHEVQKEAPVAESNSAVPIKTKTVLETPSALSFTDICSDPCIEFAIKTLTGAIPVDGAPKDDPMHAG